jgi:hypothetical protein
MIKVILSIQISGEKTDIDISTQQRGVPDFREWSLSQYFRDYITKELHRMKQAETTQELVED